MAKPVFAVLAGACLLLGCETTSSKDLRTSGIYAEVYVSATSPSASTVKVKLFPGGDGDPFNVVVLQGGDALFAEAGGQRKPLTGQRGDYQTSFALGAAETQFRAILDRARADDTDA